MGLPKPIIFISYSHKDKRWLEYVRGHLRVAVTNDHFETWDDRRIEGGANWAAEIDAALRKCAAFILLVSRHSLVSSFILKEEVKAALEAHWTRGVRIYPIVVQACDIQAVPWLTKMNLRPPDAKALALYPSPKRDEVMASLAAEIREIVKDQSTGQPPFVHTSHAAPVVLPAPRGQRIKILFVSANPAGTQQLKLDEEAREIEAKIRAADHRDSLELITKWAVRPDDLLQSLNQHRPHIVHFSGHGNPTEEIVLLDALGKPKPVSKEALVSLFRTLKDNIRVVVLNACFSRPQAEAITGEIDCAIGMTRAVGDNAAITFAASLYRAIGFGRSIKEAFDQGITALLLDGSPEDKTPVLLSGKNAAPDKVFLINPP